MSSTSTSSGATRPFDVRDPESLVAYTQTLDCIHCGLCLATCPTYELTGVESSSPRGRIHLVRGRMEGRLEPGERYGEELSFCLMCRRCESVCPAGVHFGALMEAARDEELRRVPPAPMVRALRWVGFSVLLPHRPALRVVGVLARFAEWSGLRSIGERLFAARWPWLRHAPAVPPLAEQRPLPERGAPAAGVEERGPLVLLEGCVAQVLTGRANRAVFDSLVQLGFEVHVPPSVVCCGSLHAHNGDLEGARNLAKQLIADFEAAAPLDAPVVISSAGCGSHLRELAPLFAPDDPWQRRAAALSARVRDYSEVVVGPLEALRPQAPDLGSVAYDDPCHLCHGQKVREAPRRVLDSLRGLERRELDDPEACCGAAGLYTLLRPADSAAVFAPRLADFERSGAKVLVTANPGCQLQWQAGLAPSGRSVLHLAEVVQAAVAGPLYSQAAELR
ncbi:MAG: 4Fe-4S dicluster domain-containing protein [Planctomycetaceae bacterium]|nr:4Fe-4S dicluster domain-containing protein [Planctomycetaceae bacterium]